MTPVRSPALIFGVLAAFFWGTHSVIVRDLTADLDGITIAVIRLYIAATVLFAILKVKRYAIVFDWSDRLFLVTVFGAATNYIAFHWGLQYTSASNAMMLENTAPFFVIVLLLLMGQRRTPVELLATIVALAGVYLTVRHDLAIGGETLFGDGLELVAGLTWAIFIFGSSRALSETRSTLERISFLFRVFIVSAVLLTPLMVLEPAPLASMTGRDAVLLALLGVFPTAVAYYLWYEAAARVSTVTSALLSTLSIVFTFGFAATLLGEVITAEMVAGAVLIVGAVMLSKFGTAERSTDP